MTDNRLVYFRFFIILPIIIILLNDLSWSKLHDYQLQCDDEECPDVVITTNHVSQEAAWPIINVFTVVLQSSMRLLFDNDKLCDDAGILNEIQIFVNSKE